MRCAINLRALVSERIKSNLALSHAMLNDEPFLQLVADAGAALITVLKEGKKVLFFGNGGSAADAQHLAAELTGRFQLERRALPGLALNTNTSSLTAIANDYSFEKIYARQIECYGAQGDAAVGLSTSGQSRNVLRALEVARKQGLVTIAFTGRTGGLLKPLVDFCLCVPSEETARIQEAHILTGHILCEIIERGLFSESSGIS
jgi:D-sedoheptulose 7-phosphate isomerase